MIVSLERHWPFESTRQFPRTASAEGQTSTSMLDMNLANILHDGSPNRSSKKARIASQGFEQILAEPQHPTLRLRGRRVNDWRCVARAGALVVPHSSQWQGSSNQKCSFHKIVSATYCFGRIDGIFQKRDRVNDFETRQDGSNTVEDEMFLANMILTPHSGQSKFRVSVGFTQLLTNHLAVPTLSFRRMVPNDSPVFEMVQFGSVRNLMEAASEGEVSLADCDESGRSLLNVGGG
jgi:hypothetical protein